MSDPAPSNLGLPTSRKRRATEKLTNNGDPLLANKKAQDATAGQANSASKMGKTAKKVR